MFISWRRLLKLVVTSLTSMGLASHVLGPVYHERGLLIDNLAHLSPADFLTAELAIDGPGVVDSFSALAPCNTSSLK